MHEAVHSLFILDLDRHHRTFLGLEDPEFPWVGDAVDEVETTRLFESDCDAGPVGRDPAQRLIVDFLLRSDLTSEDLLKRRS